MLDDRAVLELESDTIRLEGGAEVHEVHLGSAAPVRIEPDTVRARPGDALRFVAADARTHAVAFDASALPPAGRAFLLETGQLRGPPLIREGAAWVVSLERAPPGAYPFTCSMHQGTGLIIVGRPRD